MTHFLPQQAGICLWVFSIPWPRPLPGDSVHASCRVSRFANHRFLSFLWGGKKKQRKKRKSLSKVLSALPIDHGGEGGFDPGGAGGAADPSDSAPGGGRGWGGLRCPVPGAARAGSPAGRPRQPGQPGEGGRAGWAKEWVPTHPPPHAPGPAKSTYPRSRPGHSRRDAGSLGAPPSSQHPTIRVLSSTPCSPMVAAGPLRVHLRFPGRRGPRRNLTAGPRPSFRKAASVFSHTRISVCTCMYIYSPS